MRQFDGTPRGDVQVRAADLSALDLSDKTAVVVGGTGGLGRTIGGALASRGCEVIVVGRTFRDQGVENLRFLEADLMLLSSAKELARRLPAEDIDLLVFTTGIFAGSKRIEAAEGIEIDLAATLPQPFRDLATARLPPRQEP